MRHFLTLAALAASATALPTAAQAQRAPAATIVIVDTGRIYRECTACRTAQASLQSQTNALQTRQQTLAGPLRTEGQAIQTAINALNGKEAPAALRTRVQAFQTRERQAGEELQRSQANLQSIQQNVLRQINTRLGPAINQVMTQRGANLAVDVDATLAHAPATDVTTAVLAALNATLPSVSLTPLPAQQQPAQSPGR
ncbi:MAG: OmpH family outer membrane protein [Pseudomonadota bacterium]|nr:OmpH family outer membrane protein [Sphingomonas sp.]MDQ3477666.1 OmpH family outer membrane protein [Pseudomonadota bacterium]